MQTGDRRLLEDHDVVDHPERGQNLGPLRGGLHRPAAPLQRRHRAVGVDGDEQAVGFRGGPPQVADVPDVQEIEAPVGERDGAPGGAVRPDERRRAFVRDDQSHRAQRSSPRSHARSARIARISSAPVTVAVPRFITTRPPA